MSWIDLFNVQLNGKSIPAIRRILVEMEESSDDLFQKQFDFIGIDKIIKLDCVFQIPVQRGFPRTVRTGKYAKPFHDFMFSDSG